MDNDFPVLNSSSSDTYTPIPKETIKKTLFGSRLVLPILLTINKKNNEKKKTFNIKAKFCTKTTLRL